MELDVHNYDISKSNHRAYGKWKYKLFKSTWKPFESWKSNFKQI